MKLDPSIRKKFINQFSEKPFTKEEVMRFLEPYFEWDIEKMKEQLLRDFTRKFINSFKDDEGVREAVAFNKAGEGEQEQMVFQFIEYCEDPKVLDKQLVNIEKKIFGLFKTKRKISQRKFLINNQLTIFDFIKQKRLAAKNE